MNSQIDQLTALIAHNKSIPTPARTPFLDRAQMNLESALANMQSHVAALPELLTQRQTELTQAQDALAADRAALSAAVTEAAAEGITEVKSA